jgi:TPR repeat protein
MKAEIVEFPHYLPLFCSDHRRSDRMRGMAFDNLGYACEHGLKGVKQDTNQAIHNYEQAARLGCTRAMEALMSLHLNAEQPQKALVLVKPFLESCNSPEDLVICAFKIHQMSREDAFLLLQKGALMGNYFAIANVIVFYEAGYGVNLDLDQASYWRQKIPHEWQDKTMLAFIRFLKQSGYDHNTGEPAAKKRKLNTSSVWTVSQ